MYTLELKYAFLNIYLILIYATCILSLNIHFNCNINAGESKHYNLTEKIRNDKYFFDTSSICEMCTSTDWLDQALA